MHTAKVMVMEMQKAGFTIEELRQCPDLQAEDVAKIDSVVSMMTPAAARLPALSPVPSPGSERKVSEFAEVNPVQNSKKETVMGVKLMRDALDALSMKDLSEYERQLQLEERSYQSALDKMEHDRTTMPEQVNTRPLKTYLWRWHQALKASIKMELKRVDSVLEKRSTSNDALLDKDRLIYGPFLKMLSPDKLSVITILELLRLSNSGGIVEGMKSARALISIGKAIESEYNAEQMTKKSNRKLVSGVGPVVQR